MSTHTLIDVRPLGLLLLHRRVVLGAAGIGMWVLGLGWIGLAVRFSSARERMDDDDFVPLLVAAGIVMFPALFGVLVSEAMHEALRRPVTCVLPGLQRRLGTSAWFFAIVVSLVPAVGLSLLQPGLAPHEALGPALLGVAVGTWVMVRVGGAGFWFVRLAAVVALAYCAGPLCAAAASHPLVGPTLALVGLGLLAIRLRPRILRASLFSETSTFLTILFARGRRSTAATAAAPEHGELLPPRKLGGSLDGWVAARRFEQGATRSQIGTFGGILRFAFLCASLALVGSTLSAWIDGDLVLARLVETFVGPAGAARSSDSSGPTTLIFTFGMFAGMTAWSGSVPLLGSFLFPIGRSMQARLGFRVALTTLAQVFTATLVAGASVSAILLALGAGPWPEALPVFAWAALANLLVMPWIQVGVHTLSRLAGRLPFFVVAGAVPLPLCAVYFTLAEVRHGWGSSFGGVSAWQLVLGYLAVMAASLAFLRGFLSWHFRTCDLIRD